MYTVLSENCGSLGRAASNSRSKVVPRRYSHESHVTCFPAGERLVSESVKKSIRLKLNQAAMRSGSRRERRLVRDLDRRAERSARRVDEQPLELKRRIAATICAYQRNWSPSAIAAHFGWELDDVKRWMDAGTPLL